MYVRAARLGYGQASGNGEKAKDKECYGIGLIDCYHKVTQFDLLKVDYLHYWVTCAHQNIIVHSYKIGQFSH